MLKILENNVWAEYNHLLPYMVNLKLDESLESAIISRYVKNKTPLKPLTKVKIIDGTNESHWLVEDCSVERVSNGQYLQTIQLIEPTEALKGYVLDNVTFTQPINPDTYHPIITLYDVIERLLAITPTRKTGDTLIPIYLQSGLGLSTVQSPEFYFTEMTLFDALIEIGAYLDKFPRLKFGVNNRFLLTFDELDVKDKTNYNVSDLLKEELSHPLTNYADEVISHISNLSIDNEVVYPSENLGVLVNAPRGQSTITNDNAIITLPNNIKKITKFEANLGSGWIDYTSYMYEKGSWELLYPFTLSEQSNSTPQNKRKPHTAYYEYNSNTIYFGSDFVLKPSIRNTLFKITYIPLMNTKYKETTSNNPQFSIINNQNENIVDGSAVSKKLRNYAKRMIYGDVKVSKIYKNLSEIPKIGHLINNQYILTNLSYIKYNGYYEVTMDLSEGYTRRAEFIRAKQEIRSWEIPADGKVVERNVNYKERIRFTLDWRKATVMSQAPSITDIRNLLTILFFGGTNTYNGTFAVINISLKIGSIPLLMTTSIGSLGNNITFSFKMLDNTLAGHSKALNWQESVTMQEGVTYTDSFGNFERATIGFVSNYSDIINAKDFAINYPLSTLTQNNSLLLKTFIKISNLIVQKDARETFAFTYQLSLEGLEGTVINNNLAKNSLYQNALYWTPYIFFYNRKIYEEDYESNDTDLIKGISVSSISIDETNNAIVYNFDKTEVPLSYESVAIGYEHTSPAPRGNFRKVLVVQNDITDTFRVEVKNYGEIKLYLDY